MPAGFGFGGEFFDQLLLGFVRCMDSKMGQVQKERALAVSPDEIDGAVGQEIGKVRARRVVGLWIGFEVEMLARRDNGLVEPSLARMMCARIAQMPFAKHSG